MGDVSVLLGTKQFNNYAKGDQIISETNNSGGFAVFL